MKATFFLFFSCILKFWVCAQQNSKLLVSTGSPIDTGVVSEVIDLLDASNICEPLADFQIEASQGVGDLLDNSPLICAAVTTSGDWTNKCFVVGGSNEVATTLQTERRYAASVKFDDSTLWATGGLTDSEGIFDETLATTEFVTINGESTFGPELPLGLWGHCIAALDENSFIVAGGVSGYTIATSYIYNRLTNEWISGPQMSTDRYLFKCGSFKSEAHGGHNVVVAVGGYSTQTGMLDTAEIYDPSNPEAGWVQIAPLPRSLAEFSLITSPSGSGVLANGGINGSDRQTAIYELTCPESGCQWTEMEQKFQVPRMNHVSMLIPDELTSCSNQ